MSSSQEQPASNKLARAINTDKKARLLASTLLLPAGKAHLQSGETLYTSAALSPLLYPSNCA